MKRRKQAILWMIVIVVFTWSHQLFDVASPSTPTMLVTSSTNRNKPIYKTRNGDLRFSLEDSANSFHSFVHCTGAPPSSLSSEEDISQDKSWIYRSCHFKNICYDLREKEFVIFQRGEGNTNSNNNNKNNNNNNHDHDHFHAQKEMDEALLRENTISHNKYSVEHLSQLPTSFQSSLSIGGINPRWTWGKGEKKEGNIWAMEWWPKVVTLNGDRGKDDDDLKSIFRLISDNDSDSTTNPVLMLYHAFAPINVGHLVWDDFLPLYTLKSLFEGSLPSLKVSERSNLALMKTSILAMDLAKWLQT